MAFLRLSLAGIAHPNASPSGQDGGTPRCLTQPSLDAQVTRLCRALE
jgi:hypothetical protein